MLTDKEPSKKEDGMILSNMPWELNPSARLGQHPSDSHHELNVTTEIGEILPTFSKTDMQTVVEHALQVQHEKFEGLLRREIAALPELFLERLVSEHNKGVHGKFHMRCMADVAGSKKGFQSSMP